MPVTRAEQICKCPTSGIDKAGKRLAGAGGGGGAWAQLELTDVLLHFQQTCELYSSKAAFSIAFFAAVNHITITSNEPWNTETNKMDRNPPIKNHKPWPFEPL